VRDRLPALDRAPTVTFRLGGNERVYDALPVAPGDDATPGCGPHRRACRSFK
jgi:hypothetical protein